MTALSFDLDKTLKYGTVKGDQFDLLREVFSVPNKAAQFSRFRNRFAPSRIHAITAGGRFDLGLFFEIKKYLNSLDYDVKINVTERFRESVYPKIKATGDVKLSLDLRGYQSRIVDACCHLGRGVTVLATAGGKTLTMAALLERVYNNNKRFKCLLIVPNLSLVNQTHNDFKEYSVSFSHSMWTGNHELNIGTNVVIANTSILQSSKSDIKWIKDIDILVIDEVHGLRRQNKINKIISKIHTQNRYGFTGTMPEETIDQWNIIGKIGPVIYEKDSYALRKDDYIVKASSQVIKINYKGKPKGTKSTNPLAKYKSEIDFITASEYRNKVISTLCKNTDNNCLVLLDYIEHGTNLYNYAKKICTNKKVYFIRGDVDIDERERIRKYMESNDNVVCIAISKIFSTGVNIKNLHYLIFAGSGKAKIKTLQSIGRGLRKNKNKSRLVIFDMYDNLHYGRQHFEKRSTLYDKENIEYKINVFNE